MVQKVHKRKLHRINPLLHAFLEAWLCSMHNKSKTFPKKTIAFMDIQILIVKNNLIPVVP